MRASAWPGREARLPTTAVCSARRMRLAWEKTPPPACSATLLASSVIRSMAVDPEMANAPPFLAEQRTMVVPMIETVDCTLTIRPPPSSVAEQSAISSPSSQAVDADCSCKAPPYRAEESTMLLFWSCSSA